MKQTNSAPGTGRLPRLAAAIATLVVAVVILLPVLWVVHAQVQRDFEAQGRGLIERLNRHLNQTESVLTGFSVLVDQDSDQRDASLRAFARHMLDQHPYLHELNLFRRTPVSAIPALADQMRAAGYTDFKVRGFDFAEGAGWIPLPDDRETAWPMVFRVVMEHTVDLLGLDPAISPGIRATFMAALDSGRQVSSPPFMLTTGVGRGMVIMRPIHISPEGIETDPVGPPELVAAVMMRAEELVPLSRIPDHVGVRVRADPGDPGRGVLFERITTSSDTWGPSLTFRESTAAAPELEVTLSAPALRPVLGHPLLLGSLAPAVVLAFLVVHLIQVRAARALEQRQAAAALFREKERVEVTLNAIAEAVIGTDRDGRVTYANAAAERLLNRSLTPDSDLRLVDVLRLEAVDNGEPVDIPVARAVAEDRAIRLDRELRLGSDGTHVEMTVSPLHDHPGHCIGAVVVLRDVTEQRRLVREIAYQAEHDELTGLINRRSLAGQIVVVLQNTPEGEARHSFAFIDLDNFKTINDTHGHLVGDAFLRGFAQRLAGAFRRGDVVARLGGDEFAVVLLDCPTDKARSILEGVARDLVDNPLRAEGHRFTVRFSSGLVPLGDAHRSLDGCLRAADRACYAAKDAGRGRVTIADETMV